MRVVSFVSPPVLPLRRILLLLLGFIGAALLLHLLKVGAESISPVPLGVGKWFPASYGHPRTPKPDQVAIAVGAILAFVGALRVLPRVPERFRYVATATVGILSILATTATQGRERGFVHPVAGREPHAAPAQYWHDAVRQQIISLPDAMQFTKNYAAIQPMLGEHGRTHPPGAVLFYALLRQVTGDRPALAAVLICALSVGLVAIGFRWANAPPFALLLLCVLPAVQLYFCATLDAIVAGLLWVAIAGFQRRAKGTITGAIIALLAVSFLTFGFVWVMPVLLIAEVATTKAFPRRTALACASLIVFYVLLKFGTGFNYLSAFRFASHNENPDGFWLLAHPVEYVATRLENGTDFSFFAGPFALWLFARGMRAGRAQAFLPWVVALASIGSLLLLFLSGAYRTGETARACLFLYPPLVALGAGIPLAERDQQVLLIATFTLSAVLQCAGFYFW